ncbi:MAG: hypothetical protein UC451_08160 [Faecalibacterium sp.]|nr:hypothetical protein [Faecalibacterium sp.]
MTENSFENKALSNLAETCNAENGTYRGGDSAVGIWRVPCGESVAKMQIVMKGMKKVETEKSKPVFGGPAGSGNDASDASHAGFCGGRTRHRRSIEQKNGYEIYVFGNCCARGIEQ